MINDTSLAFFLYFSVLLAIGIISHKKQASSADFIVGNRSLNFWVIALSAHASDMSSWLFMAFPAAFYLRGISQLSIGIGLFIGMLLNWQFVSKKLRTLTEKFDSYTLPTFFETTFKDSSGIIRTITALVSVIFLACYLAAGLISMGLLLESIFGIDYYLGLTVATVVVVIYTFSGGFITVAWTDLFQALFLMVVIVIVPLIGFLSLPNGWTSIVESAMSKQVDLHYSSLLTQESLLSMFFLITWGFGYFGQPHIVTKFMGIRNTQELTKSKYVGMAWMAISLLAAAMIGVVSIAYFENSTIKPELIFVEMTKELFHPLIAGIFLCGLIAATMSTMDAQILVAASVLSQDFYKHIIGKTPSEKTLVRVTRAAVVGISVIALVIAFNKSPSVLDTVQYAWTGLGCAFGPLLLMALYSKSANRYGAISGILVGGFIAGFWDLTLPYFSDYAIPAMLPGFTL
ncbi:MAG: sodium/proline symporter, partial [Parachlamydiaceae bacterium]|nr:sodium/proline symporter [Parachlamydiaceae bacterium]